MEAGQTRQLRQQLHITASLGCPGVSSGVSKGLNDSLEVHLGGLEGHIKVVLTVRAGCWGPGV